MLRDCHHREEPDLIHQRPVGFATIEDPPGGTLAAAATGTSAETGAFPGGVDVAAATGVPLEAAGESAF